VITNLFQPTEMLSIDRRNEFNIPLPSRPELAALHVVNHQRFREFISKVMQGEEL
jgi:hypothetical protein